MIWPKEITHERTYHNFELYGILDCLSVNPVIRQTFPYFGYIYCRLTNFGASPAPLDSCPYQGPNLLPVFDLFVGGQGAFRGNARS